MAKEPKEKKIKPPLEAVYVRDILETHFEPDNWLVEGLIPSPTVSVISGTPGSFKTWICLHLALCASAGKPFLGHFNVPSKREVLILDKENHWKHLQKRLIALGADRDALIQFNSDEDFDLDNDEDVDRLIKFAKEKGIGLVIIDSLVRYHRGDENDTQQMAKVMRNIKRIAKEGINVLFMHHHRKESGLGKASANSMRGSSDIFAGVDCHIALEHKREEGVLVFNQLKLRQAPEHAPFSAKIIKDGDEIKAFEFVGEYDKTKEKRSDAKQSIFKFLEENQEKQFSFKDISEVLEEEYSKAIITSALAELSKEEVINKVAADHNKGLYSFKTTQSSETETMETNLPKEEPKEKSEITREDIPF